MLSLSNREAEIAGHLALGKTEKEVAGELCVSVDTVHTHKKSIYRKLGARSIADVTRIVAEYITRKKPDRFDQERTDRAECLEGLYNDVFPVSANDCDNE